MELIKQCGQKIALLSANESYRLPEFLDYFGELENEWTFCAVRLPLLLWTHLSSLPFCMFDRRFSSARTSSATASLPTHSSLSPH